MNRRKLLLRLVIVAGVMVGLVLLSAWIASGPLYESEFEKPISRKTRWIEVPGEDVVLTDYAGEGQTVTLNFDFTKMYVSDITLYLVWEDDMRTEPDTLQYVLYNGEDEQVISGGGSTGTVFMEATPQNNQYNLVENDVGWRVEVTCIEAKDGYIGPAGVITIPDDGNEFTVRIEWTYWKEHNPEWE